ncbi:MAG: ester cyclase [Boseongicola sp. SB0673_bin_14]|nr:ester cyclase [Boseongicola sp. SB0667_bin_21]MYI67520.1 ester cyclase [Boseongicola sp. SB0673_bin_14]
MDGFLRQKDVVRSFHAALDRAEGDGITAVLQAFSTAGFLWRGYHPFGLLDDVRDVSDRFWKPLKRSLSGLQRREDIFFAGRNEVDGFRSVWVVSMGHLLGLFDEPWLGIRPSGKIVMLRYCTFHRVEGDGIAETAMYFDIPHLMAQAGQDPFPDATAQHLVQPGPLTHDGLLLEPQPEAEGVRTLDLINAMVADLGNWDLGLPLEEELERTWHDDMLWWGPTGIGASYTIERYAKQHAGPFRAAFGNRTRTGHIARLAEGRYGGFFGWPNFTARLTGEFMARAPTGRTGEFRVIDIYRRKGDLLAENWIFIDLPHFWMTQGIDVLPEEAA